MIFSGEFYRPLACAEEAIHRDVTASSTALEMFYVVSGNLGLAGK